MAHYESYRQTHSPLMTKNNPQQQPRQINNYQYSHNVSPHYPTASNMSHHSLFSQINNPYLAAAAAAAAYNINPLLLSQVVAAANMQANVPNMSPNNNTGNINNNNQSIHKHPHKRQRRDSSSSSSASTDSSQSLNLKHVEASDKEALNGNSSKSQLLASNNGGVAVGSNGSGQNLTSYGKLLNA